MIRRCTDPRCPVFPRYGGRGIAVCAGWAAAFENFLADMGLRPSPVHSLDRRDNALGYFCGHCDDCVAHARAPNCRWATKKEQSRNMRPNRLITFRGETMPMAAWAESLRMPRSVLQHRFDRGWDVERALTQVAQVHRPGGLVSLRFNLLREADA